jgi:hypothetical protein
MIVKSLGFTGTALGMTPIQKHLVDKFVRMYQPDEAHHGDCVGADAQFHDIVCEPLFRASVRTIVHVHPPENPKARAWKKGDRLHPERDYIVRNHDIVKASAILLATPGQMREQLRSGTWSTIRYAWFRKVPTHVIFPDGFIQNSEVFD